MKIIEVRDGFIKFEADESIYLSSFIQADGTAKSYVAQVNQIRTIGQVRIANAKILFVLIGEELQNYDKTEPSKDAEIRNYPFSILQQYITVKKPIIIGKTFDNIQNIVVDSEVFNKKMLISVDDEELNNTLISNLSKQFNNIGLNSLIIDTAGVIKTKKYEPGKDFKLPLNTQTLEFMYKSCLNDATAQSKSMIAEIFTDLSEYSKTVPFVPFESLKTIVDDLVDKQHIFKLLVLKNKLAKFEQLGYFAANPREVESLNKILDSTEAVIDISKLDNQFKNYYLEYIYSHINPEQTQIFVELSNSVSKKNLKNIISDSDVHSVLISNSRYQYLNDIKSMFDNFIIESTTPNREFFKVYSSFLTSMEKASYLIIGEGVNYIPLVSKMQVIDDVVTFDPNVIVETVEEENVDTTQEETSSENVEDEIVPETAEEDVLDNEVESVEIDNCEKESALTHEEIVANIDEKSEKIIDSVSQNFEEPQDIHLFDGSDDEEQVVEEEPDELSESIEDEIPHEEINDIIEPEYSEIEALSDEQPIEQPEKEQAEQLEEKPEEISSEQETLMEESEIEEIDIESAEVINDEILSEDIKETEVIDELQESQELQGSEDVMPLEQKLNEESDEILSLGELNEERELALSEEYQENNDFLESDEEVSGISEELTEILDEEPNDSNEQTISEEELSIELDNSDEILLQDLSEEDNKEEFVEVEESPVSEEDEISIIPVNESEEFQSLDELEELDLSETQDDDIIVDMSEDEENITIDEDLDKQIVEDVDKVYTTMKEDSEELEEISDSDLDLIDELNSDNELQEYTENIEEASDSGIDEGILDQPEESIVPQSEHRSHESEILEKKDMNTPIVPVYDADIPQEDMVVSDAIQQGDSVVHAKYGNGVVEKMIKYGTKTLYSINFENIGRRLLDPMLTEIKKL